MRLSSVLSVCVAILIGYFLANIQSHVEPRLEAVEVPMSVAVDGDVPVPTQTVCTIDPLTGKKTCTPVRSTVKAAATVVGATVSKVGDIITPNHPVSYGSSGTSYQVYYPVTSYESVSYGCTGTSYATSSGYVKTWSRVPCQPLRNLGRRLLGR